MKKLLSLILFSALLSTTFAWAQTTSAYYEVPEGAFFAGMTDNSGQADPTFYVPYRHYETNPHQFSSKEAGTWKTDQGESSSQTSLSCANEMLKTCTTPQLIQDGKISFQYGATSNVYNPNLTFYVGDSVMRYMTPARLWADLAVSNYTQGEGGYGGGYKTSGNNGSDTMGVYFNNIDTMYIDGISIPICAGTTTEAKNKTIDQMFPEDKHFTVTIYHATINGDEKSFERTEANTIWSGTVTKGNFTVHPTSSYRGALNVNFNPITIDGAFVIELCGMKEIQCDFYVLSDKSNGKNKLGYYIQKGKVTFPTNYCLAVSVHAMFPVLYTKESQDVKMPAKGASKTLSNRPDRTVYANYRYTKEKNGWEATKVTPNLGILANFNVSSDDWVKWLFSMDANGTDDVREGYVTFTFRGKQLTFNLIQAPMIKSISLSDEPLSLKPEETATLIASVSPSAADPKEIKWSSDNTGVATVDATTGKVTAGGAGTATITATSNDDLTITATCEVTVTPKVKVYNVPTSNLIAPSAGGAVTFIKSTEAYKQIQYDITGKGFVDKDWEVTFSEGCDWVEHEFFKSQTYPNRAIITLNANKENKTGGNRTATVTIEAYGYKFEYPITQEAPTLKPRDNEQEFVMSLQDDTVHNTNGDKVTKVYLESEVSLEDTIKVVSQTGLTKIDKTFGSENDKYYVCLTFTRAKYVQENTDDKITVSFKDNLDNNYEYTIHHKGAGELSTKHEYRTYVVGPKGGTALAVDANEKIINVDSVCVSSNVPAENIQAEWYNDTHIGEFTSESKEDEQGSYRLIKSIKVSEEYTTEANSLDSFRVFLPNCDTIKFYVRQEPTARVWQLYGDKYNEMEVNNKGGNAHFKEFTETVMTLFSNTQVTTGDDIDITFTSETDKNWVHPSTEIKHTETRDSILITFEVDPWTGIEPRSTDMNITVHGTLFAIPLTQKAFGIKLSHEGNSDTLVVPIAGGMALWKGTIYQELHVDATEAYPDNLLKVTVPDGVNVTRFSSQDKSGLPRTTFTFSKTGTVTEDWSDSIFISFDSTNTGEGFEYHFKDTIFITQALMPSAYYEVPAGAFFAGMTNSGVPAQGEFYIPYLHYSSQQHKFSSSENGKWLLGDETESVEAEEYSCPNKIAKNHIPQLQVGGKKNYQYGANNTTYNENLYFYVGDSEMRYMTPARLWTDLVSKTSGQADTLIWYYQTQNFDTMGVFFNNIDTMYIDGISIPIKNKSATKLNTMFQNTGSKVVVNIYEATIDKDGRNHTINREKKYWTDTLTQADYVHPDDAINYGVLEKTFDDSISIGGPFVVELSEMRTRGCNFFIYSADVSRNKSTEVDYNRWGYNIKDGVVNYPTNYTPAISVHAMFPALYPKAYTDTVIYIPAEGVGGSSGNDRPKRTVFANYEWTSKGKNGWDRTETSEITMNFEKATHSVDSTVWMFTMKENTTTTERKGDVTFTFRGKSLTYHLIQVPAPYTRTVTAGEWGTTCLPYAATSFFGAKMYSIAGKMEDDKGIYLDQVEKMEAGKPYIFKATANEIKVVYAAGEPQKADTVNGLCGYIGKNDTTVLKDAGNYIVYQNALYEVDSYYVTIASNRAYIKYADVPETPSQAPQVRRVAMPINGAPANMLQVSDTKQPVKILRDGHIVILRADKEYDILGQSK